MKDVEIPQGMQRAMARQAEAERERRAKVINAEGEFQASERLKDAALVIEEHPIALQLRYLQTLLELGASQSTTIVFPAPIDMLRRVPAVSDSPSRRRLRRLADLRHDAIDRSLGGDRPGARASGPARRRRPRDERGDCPFCAGHEDRTPPETLRLGDGPTGWGVRVVPNLYPALERQEVVDPRARRTSTRSASSTTRRSSSSPRPGSAAPATRAAICFPILNEGHDGGRLAAPLALAARLAARRRRRAVVAERGLPEVVERARARRARRRLPGREPRRRTSC